MRLYRGGELMLVGQVAGVLRLRSSDELDLVGWGGEVVAAFSRADGLEDDDLGPFLVAGDPGAGRVCLVPVSTSTVLEVDADGGAIVYAWTVTRVGDPGLRSFGVVKAGSATLVHWELGALAVDERGGLLWVKDFPAFGLSFASVLGDEMVFERRYPEASVPARLSIDIATGHEVSGE